MRTHVLAFAAVAAAAGLAPAAALATAPGQNGQIAFRRYLGPDRTKGAIFVAAPDGGGERQITTPPGNASDDYPDVAADGSFVAFQRCARRCRVYTVHTDRTGLHAIGSSAVDRSYPAISPDGTRIAFIRTFGHLRANRPPDHVAIYTIGIDGSDERRVTLPKSKTAEDVDPQWSPDGRRIVFVRMNGTATPRHGQAIFVVNADGTGLHRVTPWKLRAGDGPDWSPDGKEILFRSPETEDFLHCNLFTIHPDGTGLRQATHLTPTTKLYSASFSPDGASSPSARPASTARPTSGRCAPTAAGSPRSPEALSGTARRIGAGQRERRRGGSGEGRIAADKTSGWVDPPVLLGAAQTDAVRSRGTGRARRRARVLVARARARGDPAGRPA